MSNLFENVFYSKFGQSILSAVGVKPAMELQRYDGQAPWVKSTLALAFPPSDALSEVLKQAHLQWENIESEQQYNGLLLDATGFNSTADLKQLKTALSGASKQISSCGHIVLLGKNPNQCDNITQATVMEALNGFTRSLAKELGRKAITVNLIYVFDEVNEGLTTPLNFLLSPRASYVTGQPLYLKQRAQQNQQDWQKPLAGKVALVTGAAQGIGAAIAQTLHRDGASVIGLDIPPAQDTLKTTMAPLNGLAIATDITSEQAATHIMQACGDRPLDIVVHNAGVTRDKTLGRMPEHFWDMAIDINLAAPMQVTQALEAADKLSEQARIICISSISGIAGNVGQTNYSASKSGVVGYVREQAKRWQGSGKTINAIAPGFIETQMTDDIPFMTREVGRRMNSLSQGGKPQDVAEGVALFAQPGAHALNGQILRVCGQSLIGA